MTHDSEVESHRPSGGFSREQRNEAFPPGIGAHAWFQGRNRILYAKLPDVAKRGLILDVGCGPGITVAHLRRKNVECHGCDLSCYRPEDASLAQYLHYEQDALSMPTDFRGRVGTLLMLDMLEHIAGPKTFLRSSLEAFSGLEYLLITLPARMELWSDYDERFGHVARFDRQSVVDLCAIPGLQMISYGYFFHGLYAILRARGQRRGARELSVPGSPGLHAALGGLLHLEEMLLPKRLLGSSIYALLRVV